MSIYESGAKPTRTPKQTTVPQKVETGDILNSKSLTEIVKGMKNGPKTAKELIFDSKKNLIGILQRDGEPFFLTQAQIQEIKIKLG